MASCSKASQQTVRLQTCAFRQTGSLHCAGAVEALRFLLEAVGTDRAKFYRPHDLRRGHAEDLRLSGEVAAWVLVESSIVHGDCMKGAPLWKILAAGEWRSPAFLEYLDVHKMEVEMVLNGCLDEESDCDGES